jgi:FtsH-binding integral membrane protein
MKPILMIASGIVTTALVFYSLSFFGFRRKKKLTGKILAFQTTGLILDISATILMIIGSSKGPFTLHGILGYSSLTLMIIDTVFFWGKRQSEEVPLWLQTYSKVAYTWWILAYITGAMIAMLR